LTEARSDHRGQGGGGEQEHLGQLTGRLAPQFAEPDECGRQRQHARAERGAAVQVQGGEGHQVDAVRPRRHVDVEQFRQGCHLQTLHQRRRGEQHCGGQARRPQHQHASRCHLGQDRQAERHGGRSQQRGAQQLVDAGSHRSAGMALHDDRR
jgi:hypothetical protein